ncbi:beta-mannosidase [Thelephora terrestris]|uniref:beta-mannosidase n=1 Tax=Thelephora terrestris TaxID=56493 RepID=A0A9P6H9X0_9AGAM|nr:beta-mannosidase [Thelephora terrestris]
MGVEELIEGWSFTEIKGGQGTKDGEWLSVDRVPTTVHVELLKAGRIPDPFVGLHEWDVQWVGEKEWAFKTTFTASNDDLKAPNADLVFDGLDTFATVTLNGEKILETDNQFIAHRVPVKQHLKHGNNLLGIVFANAFQRGRDLQKRHGKLSLWNGDSSRLHVRKAGYNYGWDWGPVLMTVGPWRPICFHTYDIRIAEVWANAIVSEKLEPRLELSFELAGDEFTGTVQAFVRGPGKASIKEAKVIKVTGGKGPTTYTFDDDEIALWYPVGSGKQPLYEIEVVAIDDHGRQLDSVVKTIAFRRVQIVEKPLIDQGGLSWYFEINNVPVFMGGSNWIPADSFLTRLTYDKYVEWLQLLVAGNQNMVRVWGGGIYEPDIFYDICDELGILVWQDFMFACGQYPAYDSFVDTVRLEAEQNVRRLRHHPSLVIWGSASDYAFAESLNLDLDYSDETSDFRKTNFPSRYIYERVLPAVVSENSDVHYHRGSPYSGHGKPTGDQTYGDIHQWNVWHGSQESWHDWDILAGRFVSEFGMQGYPNIRTINFWTGDNESERFPQSRTSANHNKATGSERRLELYLVENFRHAFDIESYVYYTQVMQAECLAAAYRLWRRNWKGPGREYTSGALVWQMNDCWPVTSWSIVDYFLRPKPAYFTIARELRPFTVGVTRTIEKTFRDDRSAAFFTIEHTLEIWGTNSTLEDKEVYLDVIAFDLGDKEWRGGVEKRKVCLKKNSATELFKGPLPGQPIRTKESEVPKPIVVSARLLDVDSGEVLGRYSNWPEPFKYLTFPTPQEVSLKLDVSTTDGGGPHSDCDAIRVGVEMPIKGLVLDVEGEDAKWSDQALDVVPGDDQVVRVWNLKGRKLKARYLGDGNA